jgi:hypothetical protein
MLRWSRSYVSLLALLLACSTKTTTELPLEDDTTNAIADTPPPVKQPARFLDLDIEQYQVYQEGDTTIALPQTDLRDVPKDLEAENLKKTRGVVREGDQLTFSLQNGGQKVLKSNLTEEDNTVEYIFIGSLDAIGYWEVLVFYYESFGYVLVNQRNGAEVDVWNKPVVSPDHQFVLCGSLDIEAGFIPNGFQLWSVEKDSLKLQWEKQIENWGVEKIIWTRDNYIWGEQMYRDNVSGELKTRLIRMRLFWSDAK